MRRAFRIALALAALAAFSPARAATITYTWSGTGSGTLAGQSFSGNVVFSATGDTGLRAQCMGATAPIPNCYYIPVQSSSLTLAQFGPISLANPGIMGVNQSAAAVFLNEIVLPGSTMNPVVAAGTRPSPFVAFQSWDGATALGPVTLNIYMNSLVQPQVNTTGGALVFAPVAQSSAGTFSATFASTVPEPSTWILLMTGLATMAAALRRRPRVGPQPA